MRLNTAQQFALNLDSHIVIDAGAGTGKTSTIVNRVIEHYLTEDQRVTRILPKPIRPSKLKGGSVLSPPSERVNLEGWGGLLPGEVVLLTFTNRAADEMRDRLRKAILSLKPGSIGISENNRNDPRIRNEGFVEQLMTLLEDAPIGTIDSFLSQLVSPYRWKLSDSLSKENITDAERSLLTDSAIRTIWRLPNSSLKIGDSVDAGIPVGIVEEALNARDRMNRMFSGGNSATKVVQGLVSRSVFIEESVRKIMDPEGNVDPAILQALILSSANSDELTFQAYRLHSIVSGICQLFKDFLPSIAPKGWTSRSRMDCLDKLNTLGPPADDWEKLCWMGHILLCTVSNSSLMSSKMTFFPRMNFPSHSWPPGVGSYSQISDQVSKKRFTEAMKSYKNQFSEIWEDELGKKTLHFVRTSIILGESRPSEAPVDWESPVCPLPEQIPERLENPRKKHHFSLKSEIQNLKDLHILHLAFKGVLKKIKEREEKHDFEDIQRLAADLLLANCPEICRTFYPIQIQRALDSMGEEPWRDDHIDRAFEALSTLEGNPKHTSESLGAIRTDLESRREILGEIRRRYRAFIIDEAQDNSPMQWRTLSRLWGKRKINDDDPPVPDTPWQPTVCYVGDVKQSIYAFRQAEVTGFIEFSKILRKINLHEINSIAELTRKPSLRRENHSRDPRNDHALSIARASEHLEKGGRDLTPWIPFDSTDRELPAPSVEEVKKRKEGMISLQVNYRTEGGMLATMNEWWEDIFSKRHNLLTNGNFYSTNQMLFPSPEKRNKSGSIEWICPIDPIDSSDPSVDLSEYLNPFDSGEFDRLENQAKLIALRVKSIIQGNQIRVKSSDGKWHESGSEDPISPSDIMILLPTRVKIRDIIIRHLQDLGIPATSDHNGGLLHSPISLALEGLIHLVARPQSRHNAAWVARSPLIGLDDLQLQKFIGEADRGEDMLHRLADHSVNARQRSLISRWIFLAESSRLIEILEETIDQSDLLIAHPEEPARQDAEHFVKTVRDLSKSFGGDPMVIADRLRTLRERSKASIEAKRKNSAEAVKLMTIHSSKGLEAKVVIVADLFSNRQTNVRNEQNSRLIVTPELFASHPNPWPSEKNPPISALWNHVTMLHKARKNAEARRLLYVASTRAKEKLIIAGSPKGTSWAEGEGIRFPWKYNSTMPQLGQMWFESIVQASKRIGEEKFPWLEGTSQYSESERTKGGYRLLDPGSIYAKTPGDPSNPDSMLIIHHPECFITDNESLEEIMTPFQIIESIDKSAKLTKKMNGSGESFERNENSTIVRINPSKLPIFHECARRQWLETRGRMNPEPVIPSTEKKIGTSKTMSIDPATFGTIFHRIMEIGIGNPGSEGGPSTPLPRSWTRRSTNSIGDPELHNTVFKELIPNIDDLSEISEASRIMAQRINDGRLGAMISGDAVEGHKIDGLRTEMPFQISIPTEFESVNRSRWSPSGFEDLVKIETSTVAISGIIDLVLCTRTIDGKSTIRPIDLKTEGYNRISDSENTGLMGPFGEWSTKPLCEEEILMLRRHRLQLALYYLALRMSEGDKRASGMPSREVLPPAILIGLTGRLVEYPIKLLEEATSELSKLLARTAKISLAAPLPISDFPRLSRESASTCEQCPFSTGPLPICGPMN